MKRVHFLFLGLLLGAVSLVHADEASRNAKIEEMLAAAKVDQLITQTISMMGNQMKSAAFQQAFGGSLPPEQQKLADEFQDKVMQLVAQMVSWDDLKPAYVKLYAQTFTEDEIDGMLAFYRSPAGQAMVSKTPQLMTQASQLMQQRMITMQPKLQALTKEYMDKMKAAKAEQH